MVLPDVYEIVVSAVILFAGSTVLSAVGFGLGMTTVPVLLLVLDPESAVVLVNTASLAIFVLIIYQTRAELRVREIAPVSIAGLLGVPVGVFVLSSTHASVLRISISAMILVLAFVVVFNVRGPIPRSNFMGLLVGFVAGLLLTSLGIGGPLVALYLVMRDWPRHAIRASTSFYFLLIEGSAVIGYGVAGMFTPERTSLILIVALPCLLGFGLATVLVGMMNERAFRHAVVIVIVATSVMVLSREVIRLV